MSMKTIPRITLANLPTPLIEASHLSATLGGPRILIKRDDMTGLAMGGNKTRLLEFEMADAQAKGVDVIICGASSQSNRAVQSAAAARKLGMDAILVLFKGEHPEVQGNLLLAKLLNAEVRIVDDTQAEMLRRHEGMDDLVNELRKNGRNPLVLGTGYPWGVIGYVNAVLEISQQLNERGITAEYLFVTSGSGGTHGGLALGAKYYKLPFKVIGSSIRCSKEECQLMIAKQANEAANKLLETDISLSPKEIVVYDEYIGEGYGVPTREGIEAIKLVAQTEGIFLDPVYTGKTMSALIDLIHKGRFTSKDTIIFIHTGGTPALFAYARELMSNQSKDGEEV